jgi:tetratricopeptide (TPR) repeat protein
MAGRYGMSFAKKHIEEGDFDEAVRVTTEDITAGTINPEVFFDRATALDLLEQHEAAASDFERAIELDRQERQLTIEDVDDAYFSALASGAEKTMRRSVDDALKILARYSVCLPDGRHKNDVEDWKRRVRGELKSPTA